MGRPLSSILGAVRGGPLYRVVGDPDSAIVSDVTIDSREVVPGALFC